MNNLRRDFWLTSAALAGLLLAASPVIARADGLRPAVATPLQAAERDLSKRQFAAALKEVGIANAAGNKTAYETLTIERVRAAIDASRQDYAAAAADDAALLASGGLAPSEVQTAAEGEAGSDYQAGNYAGAISTIKTYLAGDPQFETILLQSYLKTGQCGPLAASVNKISRPPPEADLQMEAFCYNAAKDKAGYTGAIGMLVAYYPSPDYWAELLGGEQSNPAFADALALDFFRLKLAAGVPIQEPEFMDMTQAALQAGLANEAASIMAQGYASNVLGSGPDADRQTRLKALVLKRQAAADANVPQQIAAATAAGDELTVFGIGFNQVDGGNAAGLDIMADAIRSGKLTRPGQAELELGIAYHEAKQTQNAKAMFRAVQGGDGAAELGKLWMYVR
jgi:hypothetical protein